MTIDWLNLKLSFPPSNVGSAYDRAQIPSTNENLENNFNALHSKMRKMMISYFKEALDAPE